MSVIKLSRFCFKINGTDLFIPNEIKEDKLIEFDRFCMNSSSYNSFKYKIAELMGISSDKIKEIKIYDSRFKKDFSIVSGNKYIISYFSNLENNTNDNKSYQEMKEYLFNMLTQDNARKKYEDGYGKYNKSEFSKLLYQYIQTYPQTQYSSEDSNRLSELETEILRKLKDYKNYRSLAISRDIEEKNIKTRPKLRVEKKAFEINTKITMQHEEISGHFKSDEDILNEYNKENDEFLEPGELDQMYDYENTQGQR